MTTETIHAKLVRKGLIEADTATKDIAVTCRRMADADQIVKAGWGKYTLPKPRENGAITAEQFAQLTGVSRSGSGR